jgi:hypothetical protein
VRLAAYATIWASLRVKTPVRVSAAAISKGEMGRAGGLPPPVRGRLVAPDAPDAPSTLGEPDDEEGFPLKAPSTVGELVEGLGELVVL